MTSPPDVLNPQALILPKLTTAERDLLVAEIGTIIFNTDDEYLNVCINQAAGPGSWAVFESI